MSKRGNILVAFAPSGLSPSGDGWNGFQSFAESEALVPFMREA